MAIQYQCTEFEPLSSERQLPRQRTLFVVGKVTKGRREYVCRVRNISENGAGIEHDADLLAGDAVTIEMRGLSQSRAVVRWVDGGMAGLVFVAPVQFQQYLDGLNAKALRSPRFAIDQRVTMRIDEVLAEVSVQNIALGGMKVAVGRLEVGSATVVGLHGHESLIAGKVCWTSAAASGVQFNRPLATTHLIAILRSAAGELQAR